jgi:uncharacterized repeat protein (TIGR02543 family)
VTEELSLKVVWSDDEYTVSFSDTQTGSGGGALTAVRIKYGETYPALPVRTAAGHTFSGWYTQPVGGDIVIAGMPMRAPNNHTLYARWTRQTYNVVFREKDDGKHIGTQTVAYGDRAAQPTDIDRAGYDYVWEKDGGAFGFSTPITEDTTLELVWTAKAYAVTRVLNYPSAPAADPLSGSVTYGAEYGGALAADPDERPGYIFTGWYTQDTGGERVIASTVYDSPAPTNHTLFAHWGPDGATYTVTFEDSENSFYDHQKALWGDKITPPPVPAQTGRKPVWKDGGALWNFAADTVTSDLTLTAEWVTAEYTVKLDTNGRGGVVPSSIAIIHGEEYGFLPTPDSVVGRTFDAWYTRGDAYGEKVTQYDIAPPKNHTLYARWTAEKYIVKYDPGYADAPALTDGDVDFDGRFSGLPKPTREGHVFIGWFNRPKESEPFDGVQIEDGARFDNTVTVPTGEPKTVTLYAIWADDGSGDDNSGGDGGPGEGGDGEGGDGTPGVYAVTFDANGGTALQQSAMTDADGKLASLPTPTQSGHNFDGWFTERIGGEKVTTGTVFTRPAVIYAHWTYTGGSGSGTGGGSSGGGGNGGEFVIPPTKTGTPDGEKSSDKNANGTGGTDGNVKIDTGSTGTGGGQKSGDGSTAAPNVSEKIRETLETTKHMKYVNGYGDNTLRPNNPITRAEVAAIFFRLIKDAKKETAPITNPFSDVGENSWYAKPVKYLANMGVLLGYNDGAFRPEQNITRAEFTAVASRFDDMRSDVEDAFVDVPKGHWAHDTILSAYAKGWISGYPGDIFLPENAITRAEVVAIVNRMLGRRLRFEDVDPKYRALYPDLAPAHWAFADMIEASVAHRYERGTDAYEIWR